ncbi:MAG: hypothetical protein H0X33_09765 [Taibaiella sp.]|nr:hypothetical protein [Taibaiella sp.]
MKKRQFKILILFLFLHLSVSAQRHHVYMNWHNEGEKEKVFELWNQYLTQKDHLDTFWSSYDKKTYKGIDLLKDNVGFNGGLYKFKFDCNVLSITDIGEGYIIKSALYFIQEDSAIKNRFSLLAIINVLAKKENGNFKLSNYINYSTANWNVKRVGIIKYHYPAIYPFNIFNAQKANVFLDSLEKWFNFSVDTINYYIPINCSEGLKMAGFEYYLIEGQTLNLCGFYDPTNNIVYSYAISGECYKHELIHQINRLYPTANSYLLAGIAAYIDDDGQAGESEKFHLKRYLKYLKDHPADFNDFYNINYVDDVTSPIYIFGAVICNALLKKGGMLLLKEALQNTRTDEQLVSFLKATFKIDDLNIFFNVQFKIFLDQPSVLLTTENN